MNQPHHVLRLIKNQLYPTYKESPARRKEQLEQLLKELKSYSREKSISFGNVQFLSAAREGLFQSSEDAMEHSAAIKGHAQIAAWVEESFTGRLLMHPKAKSLLEDKSVRSISVDLICDALDFLATDYWSRRYDGISTDEMNSRCSEKYGRSFEVTPIGKMTVEFTPIQYKIKYFPGAAGKPVETPLDFHLGVGNDPKNLLRIYFLHDDKKKLIVIGSLPRHLKAVTIK